MAAEHYETFAAPFGRKSFWTIGEVSREFDVTLRALRFYEGRGFLAPHRIGMKRLYDAENIRRLKLILKGKHLGFSLSQIGSMMKERNSAAAGNDELSIGSDQALAQIESLRRQRTELDAAIAELEQARQKMAAGNSAQGEFVAVRALEAGRFRR